MTVMQEYIYFKGNGTAALIRNWQCEPLLPEPDFPYERACVFVFARAFCTNACAHVSVRVRN